MRAPHAARRQLIGRPLLLLLASSLWIGSPSGAAADEVPGNSVAPLRNAAESSNQYPLVGTPAPPLTLDAFAGDEIPTTYDGSSLKGRVVVIEFWATWCVPCIQNIPHLNALADAYQNKGVQFISITDEDRSVVNRFLKKRPIHGWVGLDPDRSTFEAFHAERLVPQTFVVDAHDRLAAGSIHPSKLTPQLLDAILADKPWTKPSAQEPQHKDEPNDETTPAPLSDGKALLEIKISSLLGPGNMEWSAGVYNSDNVDLETLLVRLYGLPSPNHILWKTPAKEMRLSFVGRMPDAREDLFPILAVPALANALHLTIEVEKIETDVLVLTSPNGPGPDLERLAKYSHTGHDVTTINGLMISKGVDWDRLVADLESVLGKPIVDDTDFTGPWRWGLSYDPAHPDSLRTAAREQLGLALTPDCRRIPMVVVGPPDKATQP